MVKHASRTDEKCRPLVSIIIHFYLLSSLNNAAGLLHLIRVFRCTFSSSRRHDRRGRPAPGYRLYSSSTADERLGRRLQAMLESGCNVTGQVHQDTLRLPQPCCYSILITASNLRLFDKSQGCSCAQAWAGGN